METHFKPFSSSTLTRVTTTTHLNDVVSHDDVDNYIDDSNCSTPYVSAPSSPNHHRNTTAAAAGSFLSPPPPPPPPSGFFFYSAPTSPMHYVAGGGRCSLAPASSDAPSSGSFEFEFSSRVDWPALPELDLAMSSADELFLNGQIRPMELSAYLIQNDIIEDDDEENDGDENDIVLKRSRDVRSQRRRRTRSMSPLRSTTPFDWILTSDDVVAVSSPEKTGEERENDSGKSEVKHFPVTESGGSSRCSSAGRSSKRWVFLKDFLRSKSEGSSNKKFWHNFNMSFSPAKKPTTDAAAQKIPGNKRTAHEMHYAANRAQAEEMRKKTYLPYRQGLLGCLGFNSKSYGALHGFASALNPVSYR